MENKADIFQKEIKRKIWKNSIFIAIFLFIAVLLLSAWLDKDLSFLQISKALAGTAALMLAGSFSLSGFCYYWDFLDAKIGYRKYLGIVAYYFALAYSFSLIILDPDKYFFNLLDNLFTADVLLGGISMLILTFMTFISTDKMMLRIGPKKWRYALRLGYLAWFLLAIRAYILEKEIWLDYFANPVGFPPPRLLLSLLVIIVLLFRISIDVSKKCVPFTNKKFKNKNK